MEIVENRVDYTVPDELTFKRRQKIHDRVIEKIADDLRQKGYVVFLERKFWTERQLRHHYRPDIYAIKGNDRLIVEVEGLHSYHTYFAGKLKNIELVKRMLKARLKVVILCPIYDVVENYEIWV